MDFINNFTNSFTNSIKNIEISSYINLLIGMGIIVLFLIFTPIISYHLVKLFYKDVDKTKKSKQENKQKIKKSNIYKSLYLVFLVTGIFIAFKVMDLTVNQDLIVNKIYRIFLIWLVSTAIAAIFESRAQILDKANISVNIRRNSIFLSMAGKLIKIVLYIIATYLSLKELGFDLGGVATGIGIGSAILAIAMQDLVKETFAGFLLFLDKPFQIGDWIEVNGTSGSVEDISLRSTRLRTANDTLVTIANDTLISENIVNWGKIGKRIYESDINLALETREATIEKITNRIRFILKYNKDINQDTVLVTFNKIKDTGINIHIRAATSLTDYMKYTEFCHKTNLTIMNILESQGVKLAYPGSNVYIKENKIPKEQKSIDKGKDKELKKTNNK